MNLHLRRETRNSPWGWKLTVAIAAVLLSLVKPCPGATESGRGAVRGMRGSGARAARPARGGGRQHRPTQPLLRQWGLMTYPGRSQKPDRGSARRVLLRDPRILAGEGCWLWRVADGIWVLSFRSSSGRTLEATIAAEKSISLIDAGGDDMRVQFPDGRTLRIVCRGRETGDVARFATAGRHIDLDLKMGGKYRPRDVHIGYFGTVPSEIPFRVESHLPPSPHSVDGVSVGRTTGKRQHERALAAGAEAPPGGGGASQGAPVPVPAPDTKSVPDSE